MSKRVSYSPLDPYLTAPLKQLYARLGVPARFPPEGIVVIGHLCAIAGALGFAFADRWWWAGLIAALGVAGNHIADVLDGTHARATNQCRNGRGSQKITNALEFSEFDRKSADTLRPLIHFQIQGL